MNWACNGRPLHRNSTGKGFKSFTIVKCMYVGNDRLVYTLSLWKRSLSLITSLMLFNHCNHRTNSNSVTYTIWILFTPQDNKVRYRSRSRSDWLSLALSLLILISVYNKNFFFKTPKICLRPLNNGLKLSSGCKLVVRLMTGIKWW